MPLHLQLLETSYKIFILGFPKCVLSLRYQTPQHYLFSHSFFGFKTFYIQELQKVESTYKGTLLYCQRVCSAISDMITHPRIKISARVQLYF